jgi:hypothetical protein
MPSHFTACALRAPTAFLVRINTIRTKNAVMFKGKDGLGLYRDRRLRADGFSSARNRRPARTGSCPRNIAVLQWCGALRRA